MLAGHPWCVITLIQNAACMTCFRIFPNSPLSTRRSSVAAQMQFKTLTAKEKNSPQLPEGSNKQPTAPYYLRAMSKRDPQHKRKTCRKTLAASEYP